MDDLLLGNVAEKALEAILNSRNDNLTKYEGTKPDMGFYPGESRWTAFDNRNLDCWVEDFITKDEALAWLEIDEIKCIDCGEFVDIHEIAWDEGTTPRCRDCFETTYGFCETCQKYIPVDDMQEGDKNICKVCDEKKKPTMQDMLNLTDDNDAE